MMDRSINPKHVTNVFDWEYNLSSTNKNSIIFLSYIQTSWVGMAQSGYGLDGPAIKSRRGWDFLHLSRSVLTPILLRIKWVPGLSPGIKRAGRGVDQPPPSSTGVKKRVQIHLYCPSGLSWPILGRILPLPLPFRFKRQNAANVIP
jgi:hypothetical protein